MRRFYHAVRFLFFPRLQIQSRCKVEQTQAIETEAIEAAEAEEGGGGGEEDRNGSSSRGKGGGGRHRNEEEDEEEEGGKAQALLFARSQVRYYSILSNFNRIHQVFYRRCYYLFFLVIL